MKLKRESPVMPGFFGRPIENVDSWILTVWLARMTYGTEEVILTASLGASDAYDSCQLLRDYS